MIEIPLKFVTVRIYPENDYVETVMPNGEIAGATREDNQQNRDQADEQGYTGENIVWRSLVEHEVMHSVVAEVLLDSASPTLLFEAGAKPTPLSVRHWEEGIVLAFQTYTNTGHVLPPLEPFLEELEVLSQLWLEIEKHLVGVTR